MTTNEAALKLANKIANAAYQQWLDDDMPMTDGDICDCVSVARYAALAAILEVTERAADQVAMWDRVAAASLREMEHLL